jgi:hypothetical protein
MRTPTYTNVRTVTRNGRVCITDQSGITRIRPTYPRTAEAEARSARAYRRHVRRTHLRAAFRIMGRASAWAALVASVIVVSVMASAYTATRLTDRLDTPPTPAYVRSAECPTEDSCLPVWNGRTYDWHRVTP